ncbi:MAG TPA: hypothetical protein VKP68_04175, partial [Ramlibacter sp.]|nr:hypothetical protein [Ramlibacter sp.]
MNRFAGPGFDARAGACQRWGLHLLSALVAVGLTAGLWLGAASESSRHRALDGARATSYVTLPTVVVTARRGGETTLRGQVLARAA